MPAIFDMKFVLTMMIFCNIFITVSTESSPRILGGRYNRRSKSIDLNVEYGGGCFKHQFQLRIGACRESYPVQCDAVLIDLTPNDQCARMSRRKVSFKLDDVGLNTSYYSGAKITIQGLDKSEVVITLPR